MLFSLTISLSRCEWTESPLVNLVPKDIEFSDVLQATGFITSSVLSEQSVALVGRNHVRVRIVDVEFDNGEPVWVYRYRLIENVSRVGWLAQINSCVPETFGDDETVSVYERILELPTDYLKVANSSLPHSYFRGHPPGRQRVSRWIHQIVTLVLYRKSQCQK